jgi:hypothetical protein
MNSKYNGMRHDSNWRRYREVVEELDITTVDRCSAVRCDVLFTVESSDINIERTRHISISHGLDMIAHARNLVGCDAYICPGVIATHPTLKNINVVESPVPVTFFDFDALKRWGHDMYTGDNDNDNTLIATVFYPDKGHAALADAVISRLIDIGCNTYVKQRRKWQQITTTAGIHVYDDVWSPAEAIALPITSDVVVGFGSTAYIDVIYSGVQYIDCPVYGLSDQPDMSCWQTFRRTTHDFDDINAAIDAALLCEKCDVQYSQDDVDSFVARMVGL